MWRRGVESPDGAAAARRASLDDAVEVARESLLHRIEADRLRLRELLLPPPLTGHGRGAASPTLGLLAACAREADELAGCLGELQQRTAGVRQACQRQLLALPSPAEPFSLADAGGQRWSVQADGRRVWSPGSGPGAEARDALEQVLLRLGLPQGVSTLGPACLQDRAVAGLENAAAALWRGRHATRPWPAAALRPCGLEKLQGEDPGLLSNAVAATAAALLADLRGRMARRVQRAWRCFAARRLARRLAATTMLAGLWTAHYQVQLRMALAALRAHVTLSVWRAATAIARHVRGWRARRWATRLRHIRVAGAEIGRERGRRSLAAAVVAWRRWAQGAGRLRALPSSLASRAPPQRRFWALFPTDGKTAVARAQHAWALWRRALAGWALSMVAD